MGNRAVITTDNKSYDLNRSSEIGVYLHWNGGRDSVEAFLKYCQLKGYRAPEVDNYGWARLCQVIGNFFGGSTSIGIGKCCELDCDNWDNGTYIIKNWEIIDRKYKHGVEQNEYDLTEMLIEIDSRQPEHEQFGKEFFLAKEIPVSEVKVGDTVFFFDDVYGKYDKHTVMGICEEDISWIKKKGTPYVDKYENVDGYAYNANNYITTKTIRVWR